MANIFNDFRPPVAQNPSNDIYSGYSQSMPELREMADNFKNVMGQGQGGIDSMINQMFGSDLEMMRSLQGGNFEQIARQKIKEKGLDPDEFMRKVVQPAFS